MEQPRGNHGCPSVGTLALLVDGLDSALRSLLEVIPSSLLDQDWARYEETVRKMQVVNFRRDATKRLLEAMGVKTAPDDFGRRAISRIRSLAEGGERPLGLGGAGVDTTRVFGYLEFAAHLEGSTESGSNASDDPTIGYLFRESGRRGPVAAPSALRAIRLPNSGHVDRTLCAEFQLLADLCATLSPKDNPATGRRPNNDVVGAVSLFTTCSPCMSCLGAIRQFQILFPEVEVEAIELDDLDPSTLPGHSVARSPATR